MKSLTIELTKGATRQLQSIGWKTPSADDCRRHFFALDRDGKVLVVTPKPAMPRFLVPGNSVVFLREPFPEAVCVEISPCRLLVPPCYQTQEELDGVFPGLHTFDPWQWVYWKTHRQFLILEPADDGVLQKRLDKWLAAMRAAYEHESHVLRAEFERQQTKPLTELGYENEEQRKKHVLELQAVLENIVESETPIDNAICKGRLKLTLADVKRGCEGIRDAWLHEDWAKKSGEDLGAMLRERLFFFKWLETHTGTPANIIDATSRPTTQRHGIAPPGFGEKYEQDPRFLEACASVRFRARFADNAGSVVYLENCEIREELTAQERNEVAQLTTLAAAPVANPWHTEGFATIRRCNDKGQVIATLPLANEFRALCQLLAERPDQTAQYSEIEPHIGTRTHDLDNVAGVTNPAQKGERRVRDLLRTETGRRLVEWGVLTEIEVGREKFLKLTAPKPV
jgi:hypothetical protein